MQSPKRGQVFHLKKDKASAKENRPAVIVSIREVNGGSEVVVVPFTSKQVERRRKLRQAVFFPAGVHGLEFDSVAMADRISQTLISNLDKPHIGELSDDEMRQITNAIKYVIGDA